MTLTICLRDKKTKNCTMILGNYNNVTIAAIDSREVS